MLYSKVTGTLLLLLAILPHSVWAITLTESENGHSRLMLNGYIKPLLELDIEKDPPSYQQNVNSDFKIKHLYLIAHGSIVKDIGFAIGFQSPDIGINKSHAEMDLIPCDLFLDFTAIQEKLKITTGLIRPGFARDNSISASSMHSINGHNKLTLFSTARRELGILFRGLLIDKFMDYRISASYELQTQNGDISIKEKDLPGFTGRLGFNFFDAEESYFLSQSYLGEKKIVSFGLSLDLRPELENGENTYSAALDFITDFPVNEDIGIVFLLTAYFHGPDTYNQEGYGFWSDFGIRIDKFEPLIAVDYYKRKDDKLGSLLSMLAGINYFINGHNLKFSSNLGMSRHPLNKKWSMVFKNQMQLKF